MAERIYQQKLSDDDVKRILLCPRGSVGALADELGILPKTAFHYRARSSKRAMRIAREIGLPPRKAYDFLPEDDERRGDHG